VHSAKKLQLVLGAAMRVERKAKGLSQEELAEAAGISPNYYGSVERGEKMPSALTLVQIATALNMSGAEFLARAKV
jgi:transcriptional regulator with XRE-family HTH domain